MRALIFFIAALYSSAASAHVKWFSSFGFDHPPLTLAEVFSTNYFWPLFALSVASLPLIVFLDRLAENSRAYRSINAFLDTYSSNALLIMRIAMGAVLVMSWQGDSIIAPEIPIPSPFWGWFELVLALLLLFKQSTLLAGVGIVGLWTLGLAEHGLFHMLDYVIFAAAGIYLVLANLKNPRLKNLDLPVLYSGLGFSLCWVAFEKFIYPYWGISVLEQAPELTLGLDLSFFLMSAAFVEFTLGYLLIICLLQRPLAILITLVFLITTSFFGKTEVIGHTILHGALLVFVVVGPGHYYQAPIRFHKSPRMRSVFAIANFILLFFLMAIPYQSMALRAHAHALQQIEARAHPRFEIPSGGLAPELRLHATLDEHGGWNLRLETRQFHFTPEKAGNDETANEGHAHLYLNGQKHSRIYAPWHHIEVPKGEHKLRVTLNTNSHKEYWVNSKRIEDEVEIVEERSTKIPTAHAH